MKLETTGGASVNSTASPNDKVIKNEMPNVKASQNEFLETLPVKKAKLEMFLANVHLGEVVSTEKNRKEEIVSHLNCAKKHCYAALNLVDEFEPSYYGLFRVAVLENDYLEAFSKLQLYEWKLNGRTNFSLIYKMLMHLLGQEPPKINVNKDYIHDVKVSYEPLIWNYFLAETAFSKHDYMQALKHLKVCEQLAAKKEVNIDFSADLSLANTILHLCIEEKKRKLQEEFCNSDDVGRRVLIAQELLDLDDKDLENNFLYMDAYIDLKAYTPVIEHIEKVKQLPASVDEKKFVSLYERLISEIKIESSYLKDIYTILRRGSILESEALYEEAIAHYEDAYDKIGLPYFQLKKAEAAYAMWDFDSAIEYCKSYLSSGYLHYIDASTLLYKIYKGKGEIAKAFSIAFECYKKARIGKRGISLNEWLIRLENEYHEDVKRKNNSSLGETLEFQKKYLPGITEK